MEREKPFVAKLNFPVVDVRDVAAAHVKAMTSDDAAGKTRRSNKQDHLSLSLSLSLSLLMKRNTDDLPHARYKRFCFLMSYWVIDMI